MNGESRKERKERWQVSMGRVSWGDVLERGEKGNDPKKRKTVGLDRKKDGVEKDRRSFEGSAEAMKRNRRVTPYSLFHTRSVLMLGCARPQRTHRVIIHLLLGNSVRLLPFPSKSPFSWYKTQSPWASLRVVYWIHAAGHKNRQYTLKCRVTNA